MLVHPAEQVDRVTAVNPTTKSQSSLKNQYSRPIVDVRHECRRHDGAEDGQRDHAL